jgi:RNA polymerase sigma-70 factor (ECF subfamily)
MIEDEIVAKLAASGAGAVDAQPSALEREVIGLFDQLQDRLARYLLSLGLSAPDGEEIIQEVFLALFLHVRRGKPRHNLRGWVFQVAHNLALKHRNALHRTKESLHECGAAEENLFVDQARNPEDQLSWNQRRARLSSVWRALPEQDRRCLSLRAEGLTYREISQVLEMSLGSVSQSLARSLARFARADER